MFPLEILHDFLLHGFRLREFRRFTVLKGNFKSPRGLRRGKVFLPAIVEAYNLNKAQFMNGYRTVTKYNITKKLNLDIVSRIQPEREFFRKEQIFLGILSGQK